MIFRETLYLNEWHLWLDVGEQPFFGIQLTGVFFFFFFFLNLFFERPTADQVCMQLCLNPLCWELPCFIVSFQHALLPPCIQKLHKSSPKPPSFPQTQPPTFYDILSVTCVPTEATSTTSGRIFDQGLF